MIPNVHLLQREQLGNWSLKQDLENVEHFVRLSGCQIVSSAWAGGIIYSPWHNVFLHSRRYWWFIRLIKFFKANKLVCAISNDLATISSEDLRKLSSIIDIWLVPSSRMEDFILSHVPDKKVIRIPFYVSPKVFAPLEWSRERLAQALNIDFNIIQHKILIGSFQRDSLGKDLQKPKWQKNPDLLLDICRQIPSDRYRFILAGPRRHYLIKKCREEKIPYLFIGHERFIDANQDDMDTNILAAEKVNLLYNLIDYYLVTSKSEGGPKAVLEAALTKTPIFSTDVGFARDYLQPSQLFNPCDSDKIASALLHFDQRNNYNSEAVQISYEKVSSELHEASYLEKFKQILAS